LEGERPMTPSTSEKYQKHDKKHYNSICATRSYARRLWASPPPGKDDKHIDTINIYAKPSEKRPIMHHR
jgi:hypothetical protein